MQDQSKIEQRSEVIWLRGIIQTLLTVCSPHAMRDLHTGRCHL